MQLQAPTPAAPDKPDRKDPRGFVMSIAVVLFAATVVAVLTMQVAHDRGWQIF
jgi:hypothetical protein